MWRTPLAKRAAEIFRDEGIFSVWCKILALLGYRRALLIERPVDRPTAAVTPRVPVTIGRLEEADVGDYLVFRPEVRAADVRRRLQAGHECFVARHEGRIVHAAWAATGRVRIDFLARDLDLGPDEVYLDESHTLPPFRGLDIAAERSRHMRRHYEGRGYRRSLAIVFPENRQACRAAEKSGYRPIGTIGYIRLGPWRRDFFRVHPAGRAWVKTRRAW